MWHGLSAAALLRAWEEAADRSAVERALVLLHCADPARPMDELRHLPIGARDAALFEVRAATFGPQIAGHALCPACAGRLEFGFDTHDLVSLPAAAHDSHPFAAGIDGYTLRLRSPDSSALAKACEAEDLDGARRRLLEHCVIAAEYQACTVGVGELPDAVHVAATQAIAANDPCADLTFALHCPDCGHAWSLVFDIVSFFWDEIAAYAKQLLIDVDRLARAYGWREYDILAMSPLRRQSYLQLVG
jgi:hypothetical protein